ncbi:acyl-CoA dehydrogenase family protein [Cupriavidus campinensis]
MTDSLLEGFERPLLDLCNDEQLRRTEAGEGAAELWTRIDALGYTDALVSEAHGGAGLTLSDLFPLALAAARAGLPLPFAETAVARAILAEAGIAAGGGAIAIATAATGADGEIVCGDVPGAALADYILLGCQDAWRLMPTEGAASEPGVFRPRASASLRWTGTAQAVARVPATGADAVAEAVCNALHAAGMAGAMQRIQALCVTYATDRRQFGRAIGQFQAVQQELSVLAEQVAAAVLAARLGCAASAGHLPDPLLAATAKLRCAAAAGRVAAIAHAVHGAIGITEEHVLGLFTRRLHEWRVTAGTEARCASRLGHALLAEPATSLFDFVRTRLVADRVPAATAA